MDLVWKKIVTIGHDATYSRSFKTIRLEGRRIVSADSVVTAYQIQGILQNTWNLPNTLRLSDLHLN